MTVGCTVEPDVVPCPFDSSTPSAPSFSVVGSASRNNTQADDILVTLTTPTTEVSDFGSVSIAYEIQASDCGKSVEFTAAAEGKTAKAKGDVVEVKFSIANNHKVGITVGDNNRTQKLSASVKPAKYTNDVTITAGGKLNLTNIVRDLEAGVITFDIVGTEKSTSKGDTFIAASVAGGEFKRTISVVVPAKVAANHPQGGSYTLPGVNKALDKNSTPAVYNIPADEVMLCTVYGVDLSVPVTDQFDESLGTLYDGAKVTEDKNQPINVTVTSSAYTDWVGILAYYKTVKKNSPEVQAWVASPNRAQAQGDPVEQNIPVQIDGFSLNPAIVNRVISWDSVSTLDIIWPQ